MTFEEANKKMLEGYNLDAWRSFGIVTKDTLCDDCKRNSVCYFGGDFIERCNYYDEYDGE